MSVPRLLRPSLGRSLLVRTLLLSLLPLLLLAAVVFQIAERVIMDRFESESLGLARAVATRLDDRVLEAIHYARLVADIQPTRDAAAKAVALLPKAQQTTAKPTLAQAMHGAVASFTGDSATRGGPQLDSSSPRRLSHRTDSAIRTVRSSCCRWGLSRNHRASSSPCTKTIFPAK